MAKTGVCIRLPDGLSFRPVSRLYHYIKQDQVGSRQEMPYIRSLHKNTHAFNLGSNKATITKM